MYRCPQCGTRRKDYKLFAQHVRSSGHKPCTCGGYDWPHRKGSPYCVENPMSEVLEAKRRGEPSEVLLDIAAHCAWEKPGRKGPCPF